MSNDVNTEYAIDLISRMAAKLPPVWAGSEAEVRAARFLRDELAPFGVRVDFLTLRGHISHPGPGSLHILEGTASEGERRETEIRCNVLAQSEPTDGLEAHASYVGSGGASDYEGLDVRGRIVIVNLNYSPPRPEKMRLAKRAGAAGMIMINWGRDGDLSLPFGTTKYVWGNPTRDRAEDMITLPAVAVTRPDGNELLRRLEAEPELVLRITSQAERKWRELIVPVAWIGEGRDSGREFVLAGGHYDSWGGGVTDNISGDAALVAMARHFHEIRDTLVRDVVIAWWPAHESGIMIGSTWFVDSQWRLLRDRCAAYINVDQLGMGDLTRWYVEAAGELRPMIRAADAPDDTEWSHPLKTGDQSFFGVGIPSTNSYSTATEQQKQEANGMMLGWWYHSDNDTIDKLNPVTFAEGTRYVTSYVESVATTSLLPFDVTEAAEEIRSRLAEIDAQLVSSGWDIRSSPYPWAEVLEEADALVSAAGEFMGRMVEVGDDVARVARANRAIRRFSRETVPVRYSAVARYDQDSYGQSRLADVLPELYVLLERAKLDVDDEQQFFMDAEIYRALNRLSDALVGARDALSDFAESDGGRA